MPAAERLSLAAAEDALSSGLWQINEAVTRLSNQLALPVSWTRSTQLVVEEAFTNIVHYGQLQEGEQVVVEMAHNNGYLDIVLLDPGVHYNPFEHTSEPQRDASARDRALGGLGVFLIKELVHAYDYQRIGGFNRMTLRIPAHR